MNSTVQKWGNSLALRIPRPLAKDSHLHQGTEVEVSLVGGNIIVKPKARRKSSLTQLLQGITRNNLHSEQHWGGPIGRESW